MQVNTMFPLLLVPWMHDTFAGMMCVTVARFFFLIFPLAAEYLSTNSYKLTLESSSLEF